MHGGSLDRRNFRIALLGRLGIIEAN
eukprot:COSAG01_NODE_77770_length_158_cov_20.745763_1_plen_25_part_10